MLALELITDDGSDADIDQVRWTIRAEGMDPMTGIIDTSDPGATASVEVFGLPPGLYVVALEAIGAGGATTCAGSKTSPGIFATTTSATSSNRPSPRRK